jgi:hypothetical protein
MRARWLPGLLLPLLAACGEKHLLIPELVPGGGGTGTQSGPDFDVLVKFTADATGFNAADFMRILVDGVDRTGEIEVGGEWGLLRISPSPLGTRFVEIARRTGSITDSFTWNLLPYSGPTLVSVAPAAARILTQVTILGTGFDQGPLRVFFGGVEGTVDASTPTSLTATVPADALPGVVWVLVGADAADGVAEFQPLDLSDQLVPASTEPRIFAVVNARAARETAVKIWGSGFDDEAIPSFLDADSTRVFNVVVTPASFGELITAYAVVDDETATGAGFFRLRTDDGDSNELPFTVE